MKHWHIALFAATTLELTTLGCGSGGGQAAGDRMTLQGTVATSGMALDNARAIALSTDGHAYAAYLDRSGDFSLQVPTGHAYRVVIANSLATGLHQVVGHVAIRTSRGTSTWLGAREATKVDLGVLSGTQNALRAMSAPCDCDGGNGGGGGSGGGEGDHHDDDDHEGSGGGYSSSGGGSGGNGGNGGYHGSSGGGHEGDHDDDHACEQDDDEHGKVCTKGGGYDVELSPSNDPGDKCDDKDLDDDEDKKNDEDHEASCDAKGGGSGKSGGGYGGGSTGGGSGSGGHTYDAGSTAPPSGSCHVSADCGGGSCVACACTP